MPRDTLPKLGSKRFDNKSHLPDLSIFEEESSKDLFRVYYDTHIASLMLDLVEHFQIKNTENLEKQWYQLSYHLVETFIQGAKFKKPAGAKVKWSTYYLQLLALYFDVLQKQYPDQSNLWIFAEIISTSEQTNLSAVISSDMKSKALQDRYYAFLNSDYGEQYKEIKSQMGLNPFIKKYKSHLFDKKNTLQSFPPYY